MSAVGKESWRTATFHRAGESRRLEGISGTHPAHTLLGAERLSEMHWCHRAARAPPAEQGEPAPEYGNKAGRGSSLNDKTVSPRVPNVEGRTCMAMVANLSQEASDSSFLQSHFLSIWSSVLVHTITQTQVQDFALTFVQLLDVPITPFSNRPTCKYIDCSSVL